MPVTFSPVGDFAAVCDGLQTVTLTDRDGVEQTVTHALRRSIRSSEAAPSNGHHLMADVRWHLPIEEVTGEPLPGWTIDDGTDEWTILVVSRDTLSDRWNCYSRNLVVTEGLNTLITIEVATVTKGDGGAHEQTWSTLASGVRAKIQRLSAESDTEHGVRQLDRTYRAYWREALDLRGKHRIIDNSGVKYLLTAYRDPERIDVLAEADLELWTEGTA